MTSDIPKPDDPAAVRGDFRSLSPPVWRASTILFDSVHAFTTRKDRLYDGYTYGITGTPTTRALEDRIAALEGADHCVVSPSGQAALCLVALALVRAGDHVLIPDCAYGPLKTFAQEWLAQYGVRVDFYPPRAGEEIRQSFTPQTRLVFLESPGSLTMEMQDIPAIVAAAKAHGAVTAIDNTWATPLGFQPIARGVDISVQAASKLFGGHSDVLLGSISTSDRSLYERLRRAQSILGQAVSAEDCFLVLRGLDTLGVRYARQCESALAVARWLAGREDVDAVLFPPLPESPGHERWRRDFRGGGCVLTFAPRFRTDDEIDAFFSHLRRFSIGASWGGVHSLAAYYPAAEMARRTYVDLRCGLVRLSVGLEPAETLIADLADGFRAAGGR